MEEILNFIRATTLFLLPVCSDQLLQLLKLSTYFTSSSSNLFNCLVPNRNTAVPNRSSIGLVFVLLPAFSRIPRKSADGGLKYIYGEWQEWKQILWWMIKILICGIPYNLRQNSGVSWPWKINASCACLLCSQEISCFHTFSCKRSWKTATMNWHLQSHESKADWL